jgi:hypothetical protein
VDCLALTVPRRHIRDMLAWALEPVGILSVRYSDNGTNSADELNHLMKIVAASKPRGARG